MQRPVFVSTLISVISILLVGLFQNSEAQSHDAIDVSPVRISNDFEIDADMKRSVWENAPAVSIEYQIEPNDNVPAPVDTKVKVLYSEEYLYIGFICEDPNPENIRANISDRDNSFSDDYVGAFIDPFNNNQHAYELFVNPLGIQMDGVRTGNKEDMNFDLLWQSKGKITNTGYKAVMKVPFKSLNFPDREVQNWSIQFIRNYPRSNRYQMTWSDVRLSNSCFMCQNGLLEGMEDIENSNTLELLPYGMSFQSSSLDIQNDPSSGLNHGPVEGRLGGSVRYSPSSTTSLHAVVNPDFSQVETDAAKIGANETFALFFSEKRPFFMKGSDLFSTRKRLFYSRMINRPLAAGKVTQKSTKYSIAFLTAYDRSSPFIVPGRYRSSSIRTKMESYNNVLRAKYNFGPESYVGGLLTTRNQDEGSNYVGSLDWDIQLADQYYFSGQLAYSDTKEINDTTLFNEDRTFGQSSYDAAFNGERFSGSLISANFSREAKYYNFSFGYESYSPTFQAQSGFINRTDQRKFETSHSISYYPDRQWFSNGRVKIYSAWRYDFTGQFQERFIFTSFSNDFAGQTNVRFSFIPLNDERFRGKLFTGINRYMIDVRTNPIDALSLDGHIDFGEYIYRAQNPARGEGYNISADATLKPTQRLEMNVSYNYSTLSSVDGSQEFYSGDIFRLTGRYNFTKKLFARLITQYNSFNDQIQLYPLVYYKANPFTKFYLGMTDYLNHFDQPGPNGFEGYKETDRQFFVKFQYLIRS